MAIRHGWHLPSARASASQGAMPPAEDEKERRDR
jgi:hypothetical protein